ncbi:TetR/AcrR family transcriptional regulator [Novosphingobium aquiterrae]|uniref:TetR/AcrR family transcriptional regulator n=1 Tax=Novosphingobium aquiterrae TaxID=624388 RepID=A0ABV6PFS2_9SPHN
MTGSKLPRLATRKGYHHGNLTEVLVAAAVALIEERGVEALSVREVAKRAGVSSGAPFRHFDNKTALLTAVAEQAMERFVAAVDQALDGWPAGDPIGALRAMGRAYLQWATKSPVHFRIISSRRMIDFTGSARLVAQNAALQQTMRLWVERARNTGKLREGMDTTVILLSSRAQVYGLARMWCDDHLQDWQGSQDSAAAMLASLDSYIDGLTPHS